MSAQRNHIDDFFRDSLSGARVTPSEGTWSKIERGWSGPWRSLRFMIYLSASLILFSSGLALYFGLSGPVNRTHSADSETVPDYSYTPVSNTGTGINEQAYSSDIAPDDSEFYESENEIRTTEPYPGSSELSNSDVSSSPASVSSQSSSYTYNSFNRQSNSVTTEGLGSVAFRDKEEYPMLASLNSPEIGDMEINFPLYLTKTEIGKLSFLDPDARVNYLKPANLGLGIHATPGVTFYDPNPNKYFLGLDVTLNYSPSRWLIQIGAGINRMQDEGKYSINYTSIDSVGYYAEVTSFHYAKDNPDSIVIESHNRTVYDSIPRVGVSEKNNTYTYFTVPFHVGYRIFQTRKIDGYLKAGVVFGLLVHKDEPTADFTATNASDVYIERQVPARVNASWQYTLGMHFGYRLGNRILFSVEPYFGQYFTPVYQEGSGWENNKPFLFGVRTGIDITF